jgi:hypothetical protein
MTDWTKVPSGTGAGGGFGTVAPNRACAIEDCTESGTSMTCPYDGTPHRHGMIHYNCGAFYKANKSRFRERWHLLCKYHADEIWNFDEQERKEEKHGNEN